MPTMRSKRSWYLNHPAHSGRCWHVHRNSFSALTPEAWSPSKDAYDQVLSAPVIATVPTNATVRGFRFRAWDEHLGEMECTAGKECSFAACAARPAITWISGIITVYTVIFQNWSTDWPREGRLIIFFEMPAGKVPLEHL
jgi:hypothetical protein